MIKLDKKTLLDYYFPATLFLTAFLWKFLNAGARDICIDEPFTIFHAQESIKNILLLPTQNEPHPPLFMIIMHLWIKLFGVGPFSVRAIPILFNAFTVLFLYFTGKKFFSFWSGLIASGLFIFSIYHFYFGADTRAYSMLSLATAAALYYFLSTIRDSQSKKYLIGLIVANIILVYSHYFGWFVVGMQFMSSFLYIKDRRTFKKIWIALLTTGILYAPMFVVLIKQFLISSKGTWVQPPPNSEYINQLIWFMNSSTVFRVALYIIGIGIVVAFIPKIKTNLWKEILITFIWWIIPYSFMFFISSKIPMFTNRYILFNSIGFYIFIGAFVSFLYSKTKILLPIASVVLIGFMGLKMYTGEFAPRRIKDSANFLKSKEEDNSLILIHPQWSNLGFMYYYDQNIFTDVENYYSRLEENNIKPVWSITDAKRIIDESKSDKILFYQNNSISIDPSNAIFHYLDSIYTQTDSAYFLGGTIVNVFAK